MRAGSRALSIFTYALNARVLRAHAEGPIRKSDLQDTIGWAPQTSLRVAVANLCNLGILAPLERDGSSRGVATDLTPSGRELVGVADSLEHWLLRAPTGPIGLDGAAAVGAVRTLTAGWDSTLVRLLAEGPLTLTELNAEIAGISYPALERRIASMRSNHLIVPVRADGKGKPYEVSDWLRRAIAPLSLAGRWERRHMAGEAAPITRVEVEAAFLLTLPLVELQDGCRGGCALTVLTLAEPDENGREVAGVTLEVREGRIVSCTASAASDPETWALGTPDAWLEAVIDGRVDSLRVDGENPELPLELVRGLHEALFPSRRL